MNKKFDNEITKTASENLAKTLKTLISESGINQVELSNLSNIPYSTVNAIATGLSDNPRLHTLINLAKVFNVNLSQMIGQIPLNYFDAMIPILEWENIDYINGNVNFDIKSDTKFISTSSLSKHPLYALRIKNFISEKYNINTLIILEYGCEYINNNDILVSINNSEPYIKKIVIETNELYLSSVSNNLPLQKFDKKASQIYGIIREVRLEN